MFKEQNKGKQRSVKAKLYYYRLVMYDPATAKAGAAPPKNLGPAESVLLYIL